MVDQDRGDQDEQQDSRQHVDRDPPVGVDDILYHTFQPGAQQGVEDLHHEAAAEQGQGEQQEDQPDVRLPDVFPLLGEEEGSQSAAHSVNLRLRAEILRTVVEVTAERRAREARCLHIMSLLNFTNYLPALLTNVHHNVCLL